MLNFVLDRWRLFAFVAAAAMLAVAHGFETFGGYAPCTLCLRQREAYWVAGAVALGAMVLARAPGARAWRPLGLAALALVFLAGAGIAAYHAGVEWKFWPGPTACSGAGGGVSAADMAALLDGAKVRPPACDQAAWVFAGLSMAGWNALAALALAGASLAAMLRERARR
jgi:disulfide bond formation protein DsbB